MEKLTEEQLQFIENALINKCNFKNFDDVRLEIVDHIAVEIEDELNITDASFEQAFVKVMTRWNPMILPKTWSRYENVPYIITKLWKSLDWKFQFSAIPLAAIFTYIGFLLQENNVSIYLFIMPFLFIGIISNVYLLHRKFTNKINSTLSTYSLQKIFKNSLTMIALMMLNVIFLIDDIEYSIIPVFWPTIYCSLLMLGKAWVMHKHLKIENQLLKVI